ncbi:amidohydrolase family protein [Kribbella sp. NPDC051770]|uniref:amidohydrolase family protein n=1 Tax=Kribbella sp. NPDC051770 TaxID=3155413 RepID=UPI0034477B2D
MIVDAHHHFWQLAAQEQPWRDNRHGAIARDYTPEDLSVELTAAGVDRTVLIQSVDEPAENDRLLEYARTPYVGAVVGWLPLSDPKAAREEIARVAASARRADEAIGSNSPATRARPVASAGTGGGSVISGERSEAGGGGSSPLDLPAELQGFAGVFSGVRCLVGRDPMEWLGESVGLFRELASAGIAWDVVPVTAEQTKAVLQLADAVPELRIVVDHLGRPPVDSGVWEPWAGQVRELAACPQVGMKVSLGIDLLTELNEWPDIGRYLAWVVECFGVRRLMVASNWPVVLLRASYGEAWSNLRGALEQVLQDGDELAAVLGGTAADYYRIN